MKREWSEFYHPSLNIENLLLLFPPPIPWISPSLRQTDRLQFVAHAPEGSLELDKQVTIILDTQLPAAILLQGT
jgi:hypothetical protein